MDDVNFETEAVIDYYFDVELFTSVILEAEVNPLFEMSIVRSISNTVETTTLIQEEVSI